MVEVIKIERCYERLLLFLYPTYSYVAGLGRVDRFIVRHDIRSRAEYASIVAMYGDCVICSDTIFDAVWDVGVLKDKVLAFGREHFRSRKRVLDLPVTEGDGFVDCCVRYMYSGDVVSKVDADMAELFVGYGSTTFGGLFIDKCASYGVGYVSTAFDTYLLKVCGGVDGTLYKKAYVRFGAMVGGNIKAMVEGMRYINGFWYRHFKDLTALYSYMLLGRQKYLQ